MVPASILDVNSVTQSGAARRMCEEEFVTWVMSEEHIRAEWINGKVLPMSPASAKHVLIIGWLHRVLGGYIEDHELGQLMGPKFMVRLTHAQVSLRVPDLIFITTAKLGQIQQNHLEGAPDLAIEIISTDSVVRDRQEKSSEYEASGVREYWIIDPKSQSFDAFVRNTIGRFDQAEPTAEGVLYSATVTGFWLRVDWLWQEVLPRASKCLREIAAHD